MQFNCNDVSFLFLCGLWFEESVGVGLPGLVGLIFPDVRRLYVLFYDQTIREIIRLLKKMATVNEMALFWDIHSIQH